MKAQVDLYGQGQIGDRNVFDQEYYGPMVETYKQFLGQTPPIKSPKIEPNIENPPAEDPTQQEVIIMVKYLQWEKISPAEKVFQNRLSESLGAEDKGKLTVSNQLWFSDYLTRHTKCTYILFSRSKKSSKEELNKLEYYEYLDVSPQEAERQINALGKVQAANIVG